jgi:Arm DNA-binding domain
LAGQSPSPTTGGVSARGSNGVQYDFMLEGVRYRPTLKQIPTEANLRRARDHLKAIKERIRFGTFSFAEEFPDFRDLHKLINRSPWRTCNQVFDEYLQQCESRLAKHDLSLATVVGYRKVLDSIWRPKLGTLPFLQVPYSMLVKIAPELAPSSAERDRAAQVGLTLLSDCPIQSGLPREGTPVAEFGTRFVTRCGTLATQVPEEEEKESGGEGGITRRCAPRPFGAALRALSPLRSYYS